MVTLYLLRHAKAKIGDDGMADIDRPLAKRGIRNAAAMGVHLAEIGIEPDLILCSSARRARETLGGVLKGLAGERRVEIEEGLYTFDSGVLRQRIAKIPKSARSVLVIGHNPAFEILAAELLADAAPGAFEKMRAKFPTCAFAELVFETDDWRSVRPNTGRLQRFLIPREL